MTLAATTVSIVLTFGTSAIIDHKKKNAAKREMVLMIMYDMKKAISDIEVCEKNVKEFFDIQVDLVAHPEKFDDGYYGLLASIPIFEYPTTTENIFKSNIETVNTIGNILFVETVTSDVLFSCLGTTIRAAGSQDAQWKVDYTYQLDAAKAARSNGVPTYVLVSSIGAHPQSKVFYTRMKGTLEEAVQDLGYDGCIILRPTSLIRKGSDRFGEKAGVAVLRVFNAVGLMRRLAPIPTEAVAAAMVRLARRGPDGIEIISAQDILKV